MQENNESILKRDADRTRKKLLEAAESVFVLKGYDAARVDEIAKRAGVNKRMIYLYFGKKEDIYYEVLKSNLGRFLDTSRKMVSEDRPYEMAVSLLRHLFESFNDNRGFVRLLAWESLRSEEAGHNPELVRMLAEGLKDLVAILEKGSRDGVFRSDLDVRQMVLSVVGVCLTYFQRRMLMQAVCRRDLTSPEFKDEVVNQMIRLVFEGILPRKDNQIESH